MPENTPNNQDQLAQERQKAHFERARKGVLKFLNDKGGQLPLAELHDYSLNKFLIQHQAFSRLMESLVDEKLVTYDFKEDAAEITEAGRNLITD